MCDIGVILEFKDDFRFLSNFYPSPVEYEGRLYPSVENAYQAAKFANDADRIIFTNISAGKAKRLGKGKQPGNWKEISLTIMNDLVKQKFTDHSELKTFLLSTGDKKIIEGNTWGDVFWGECPIGNGENHLGKILMRVRKELE